MTDTDIDRRRMCAAGGMLFLVAGGQLRVAKAAGLPSDTEAYSLWHLWSDRSLHGTPLALVAAGVLAANPHDTQPWAFHLHDDAIDVYADLSRNLGAMDAMRREMHLALGCAIQNMLLAAPVNGYAATVEPVPGSIPAPNAQSGLVRAATLRLEKRAPSAPDALYRAIPERHTNRYGYDRAKPLPAEWREFAGHAEVGDEVRVFLFGDGPDRARFDALVNDATTAIINDNAMAHDNTRWIRNSRAEIEAHRDGITMATAGLSPFMLFFANLLPVSSDMSNNAWASQTRDTHLATAPLVGLVAVRDRYDRPATIAAGRTWQRLHLSATAEGIAMQPLNQPIEMVDRERQTGKARYWDRRVAELTGSEWQATFSFRAGYCDHAGVASPRRALKDVLKA